jgi:hypothetical protein
MARSRLRMSSLPRHRAGCEVEEIEGDVEVHGREQVGLAQTEAGLPESSGDAGGQAANVRGGNPIMTDAALAEDHGLGAVFLGMLGQPQQMGSERSGVGPVDTRIEIGPEVAQDRLFLG